jgi:hypothetical protein
MGVHSKLKCTDEVAFVAVPVDGRVSVAHHVRQLFGRGLVNNSASENFTGHG